MRISNNYLFDIGICLMRLTIQLKIKEKLKQIDEILKKKEEQEIIEKVITI